jgi:hypothetical protein
MRRRLFLKLLGMPVLAFVRPRASALELRAGLVYSDSVGTIDFSVLQDGNATSGIEYLP